MDEEVIEKVKIAGRVFIPEDSLKSSDDLWEEKQQIKKEVIKDYIEEQEEKRLEISKKINRCKICRCNCGCHPCKHTKDKIKVKD